MFESYLIVTDSCAACAAALDDVDVALVADEPVSFAELLLLEVAEEEDELEETLTGEGACAEAGLSLAEGVSAVEADDADELLEAAEALSCCACAWVIGSSANPQVTTTARRRAIARTVIRRAWICSM